MEELPELYELEAMAAADVANTTARHHRIQRIIARREALLANKPLPRRGNLRPVIAIPLGRGGGAAALKAWLAAHRRTVTAAAGVAVAGAATGILGAILIDPATPGREHLAEPPPPPPAIALPPYGHTPPPVGPPKGSPPAAPPTGTTPLPAPSPSPRNPTTPPGSTATPPGTTQSAATTPPADPPGSATQLCGIYVPKLGTCSLRIRD